MLKQLKPQLRFAAIGLLLMLALSACGLFGGRDLGPETYDLDEESVPAFAVVMTEEGKLSSQDGPSTNPNEIYTFHYEKLGSAGEKVADYVALLTQESNGFSLVNAAGQTVPAPDYTEGNGYVILSRPNEEAQTLFRLIIQWEEGKCTVKVSQPDATSGYGSLLGTEKEEESPLTVEGTKTHYRIPSSLSAEDAVSLLEGMHPSILGLEGDSMDDYNVYYLDAKAMVDGYPCLTLRVYEVSQPEGSNAIAGTYLLCVSQSKLYRLDVLSADISELDL